MDPDKVVAVVKDSELRGRGGAGFPCGLKWTFLPKDRKETLMCVNGDESEPATFNNRLLIEQDPHQFIEGILISCFATKASTAYVYIRFEYIKLSGFSKPRSPRPARRGIWAKTFTARASTSKSGCHRGAGAYICGEETGLIESLEGKRGWPRIKPPFPAIEGAFRKPTVVNNVETLCCVPHIVERGADWFKSIGTPKSYGPKLYCVSGHVNKQVCVELPLGITCRALIDEYAGGVWKGRKAKAAVPGGISMGLLSADELDTPLDFESLQPGCLGLGTAAVTVIDDQTSIVDYLYNTCPLLRSRELRPVHPVPRGNGLDLQDHQADQSRRRPAGRPRHGRASHEQHGHHAGHDDLRARRRRGLALEKRPGEVPARDRRVHPDPPDRRPWSVRVARSDLPRHDRAVGPSLPIVTGSAAPLRLPTPA